MPWDPDFYNTQTQLFQSVSIGEKVVDMTDLVDKYDRYVKPAGDGFSLIGFVKGLFAGIGGGEGGEEGAAETPEISGEPVSPALSMARMSSGGLGVSPVKDSKVVTISYTSPSPELAALIVNAAIGAYHGGDPRDER